MAMASAVVALAYIVLTIVLFRSNPGDRQAGLMFMLNIPALIGLPIVSTRSTRTGVRFGATAAIVQSSTMGVMLYVPGSKTIPAILINFAVTVPVLSISTWAWFFTKRRSVSPDLTRFG